MEEDYWYQSDGYQQGYKAGKQAKRDEAFFKAIFLLIGSVLMICVVYSSSLVTSLYLMVHTGFFQRLTGIEQFLSVLAGAYLITCLIFFLKGIMIAWRISCNGWWRVIWVFCFLYVCGLPVLALHALLENMSETPQGIETVKHHEFWSWVGALVVGTIIYGRYRLSKDHSLVITQWAYKLGIRVGGNKI